MKTDFDKMTTRQEEGKVRFLRELKIRLDSIREAMEKASNDPDDCLFESLAEDEHELVKCYRNLAAANTYESYEVACERANKVIEIMCHS